MHHIKKHVAMRLFPLIALASCLMALPSLHAQAPCRDTIVRVHDSICEGESYTFHGRTIYHSGLYFDTLPRVNDTLCDSVVILRLSVLEYPETGIGKRQHCRRNIGWDLISGFPGVNYYHWTSEPDDSTLHGQERLSWIHVNPQQPTTYHLHLDYRESPPQCPFDTSISINPVVIVVAAMHAEPDEITYDDMHIIAEDFSIGTREYLWGGWAAGKNRTRSNPRVLYASSAASRCPLCGGLKVPPNTPIFAIILLLFHCCSVCRSYFPSWRSFLRCCRKNSSRRSF